MESDFETVKNIFVIVLGALMLIVGISGNSLVVVAVWKKRSLRSTTNYLLVNMSISGITCLGFLPLMLIEKNVKLEQGTLSDFLCKFIIFFHVPLTASFVSILTLTVLSVERYHAVVKPMKTGFRLREDTVKYALIAVWISAITFTLPFYIFGRYERVRGETMCDYSSKKDHQTIYVLHLLVFVVFIPFFIISFCYFQIVRELYFKNQVGPQNIAAQEEAQSKRKLVRLSLSITLAFVVCFFPMAITLILTAYDEEKFGKKYKIFTTLLYVLESVLNPFLYAFQSTNFRQAFKELLKFNFSCNRQH